jgi:hypothetical protein
MLGNQGQAVLNGSGASGQPTGIIGTSGIGGVTGASITYAGILEFQTDVAGANVVPASGGYVTTPPIAALLMARQRFSSTDTPLWIGNIWDGAISKGGVMQTKTILVLRAFYFQGTLNPVGAIVTLPSFFAVEMKAANKAEIIDTPPPKIADPNKMDQQDTKNNPQPEIKAPSKEKPAKAGGKK